MDIILAGTKLTVSRGATKKDRTALTEGESYFVSLAFSYHSGLVMDVVEIYDHLPSAHSPSDIIYLLTAYLLPPTSTIQRTKSTTDTNRT